mmetsp:Transcript_18490/g.21342  ORF Transcript_18490/g.21342 Transcript_18490/m.21342 type:complete len:240 (+) Transcript_18490:1143-1862(+)
MSWLDVIAEHRTTARLASYDFSTVFLMADRSNFDTLLLEEEFTEDKSAKEISFSEPIPLTGPFFEDASEVFLRDEGSVVSFNLRPPDSDAKRLALAAASLDFLIEANFDGDCVAFLVTLTFSKSLSCSLMTSLKVAEATSAAARFGIPLLLLLVLVLAIEVSVFDSDELFSVMRRFLETFFFFSSNFTITFSPPLIIDLTRQSSPASLSFLSLITHSNIFGGKPDHNSTSYFSLLKPKI